MKSLARIIITVAGLFLLGVLAITFLTVRIEPWQLGVKQNQIAGGFAERDFGTGFRLSIPGMHVWHVLERRTHFVTFGDERSEFSMADQQPPLEIRTKDNNLATYDVTVMYRIKDGEAHLIVAEGNKLSYRDRVLTTVESVLREGLAELASEQTYSTDERMRVVAKITPELTEALAGNHVVPEEILIRAISFPEGYEQRLQEKQLTYQTRELAEATKFVENQRAITLTRSAEIAAAEKTLSGDFDKQLQQLRSTNEVKVAEVLAAADVYDRGTRAQADARYTTAVAEGRLSIETAEALRDELRNAALDTVGGRIFLAQKAATNLQFESITLNSNDPRVPSVIDLDGLVRLLIGAGK
jgi:regulator of protease activity HflC (stomatin/prohibitin superfamily)